MQNNIIISDPSKASSKEVAKIVGSLIKGIKDIRDKLSTKIDNNEAHISSIEKDLVSAINTLSSQIQNVSKEIEEDKECTYNLTEADKKSIASQIDVPVVEKIIEKTELTKEITIHQTGEEIVDIINALSTDDENKKIDKEHINGWKEEIDALRKEIRASQERRSPVSVFGGARNTVQVADLTAQCDGITKTFEVPSHRFQVSLQGTQFPIVYRPVIDYTVANRILTLTSEVSAPDTGQTLIFLYIK